MLRAKRVEKSRIYKSLSLYDTNLLADNALISVDESSPDNNNQDEVEDDEEDTNEDSSTMSKQANQHTTIDNNYMNLSYADESKQPTYENNNYHTINNESLSLYPEDSGDNREKHQATDAHKKQKDVRMRSVVLIVSTSKCQVTNRK